MNYTESFLAPAKLNLGLKVVAKRSDGYHELKTVFCLVDMFDHIEINVTDRINNIYLHDHNQAWPYFVDLSYKAAKLLKDYTNCPWGANLRINKVIPSGAGMGGGSSDAATILLALNKMWRLNLSINQLINLGRNLGADVPVFLEAKHAYAEGVGDVLTPIELPQMYFVIVKPPFHVPTKGVFEGLDIDFTKLDKNAITQDYLISSLENDLFVSAAKIYPELNNILTQLSEFGAPVMTGSGSCLYFRFFDEISAKNLADKLKLSYNIFLVKSLTI